MPLRYGQRRGEVKGWGTACLLFCCRSNIESVRHFYILPV